MIFAALLVFGTSWMVISSLSSTRGTSSDRQTRNAAVLQQAKSGLLGYMAVSSSEGTNDYPGKLPCPEAANPSQEGVADAFCSLPAVGRLPWRTLGLEKLVDVDGEPLWYVVSPGFNRPGTGTALKINSDTPADLTVDSVSAAAVAIIIAPGKALSVPSSANCAQRAQARARSAGGSLTFPLDLRDYLECENATSPADKTFVTAGPANAFNDQMVRVTHAELFGIVEAAVAKRFETEIVPMLKSVYASGTWGASATTPRFPFAASFASPDTATFQGSPSTVLGGGGSLGQLPVVYSYAPGTTTACDTADRRCNPSLVRWNLTAPSVVSALPAPPSAPITYGFTVTWANGSTISIDQVNQIGRATLTGVSCASSTSTNVSCTITYGRYCGTSISSYPCSTNTVRPRINVTVEGTNIANSMRTFDASSLPTSSGSCSAGLFTGGAPTGSLQTNGNARVTTEWRRNCSVSCNHYTCGVSFTVNIPVDIVTDHAVVNSTDPTAGWFLSNDWHKLAYYAVSPGNTPGSAGTCTAGGSPDCLTVSSASGSTFSNAVLVLSGRNLGSGARPSSLLTSYLEGGNADGTNLVFDNQKVSRTFNDRVSSIYP
jgi:hypothetical protein